MACATPESPLCAKLSSSSCYTVLNDAKTWLTGLGSWKVSESTFYVEFGDVRSEWIFIPLEDFTDQADC